MFLTADEIDRLRARLAEAERDLAEQRRLRDYHGDQSAEWARRAQEAERDAARYRWLRDVATTGDWCELGGIPAEMMEREIDAAMERTQ